MFATVLKLEKSLQACKGLMTSKRVGSQLFMVGISRGVGQCQAQYQYMSDLASQQAGPDMDGRTMIAHRMRSVHMQNHAPKSPLSPAFWHDL